MRAPGVLVALPCAFVLRRFQVAADGTRRGSVELSGSVYEIALVILSAYMAYLVAEVLLFDVYRMDLGLRDLSSPPTWPTWWPRCCLWTI